MGANHGWVRNEEGADTGQRGGEGVDWWHNCDAEWGAEGSQKSRTYLQHAELARALNPRHAKVALAHRHERAPLFGVAHHLPSKRASLAAVSRAHGCTAGPSKADACSCTCACAWWHVYARTMYSHIRAHLDCLECQRVVTRRAAVRVTLELGDQISR